MNNPYIPIILLAIAISLQTCALKETHEELKILKNKVEMLEDKR